MKRYMVEHCEGELLGPIDWSYDFCPHFSGYCCPDDAKREMMVKAIDNLWAVERLHIQGQRVEVCTRDFWHPLIAVGMYDGWPYWKPVPSILVQGPLGAQWEQFPCVDDYRVKS